MRIYCLDFNISFPYFYEHIFYGNRLSKEIIANVDLTKGKFFTILPEDANFQQADKLDWGGIILSKGLEKAKDGKGYWEEIPNTSGACGEFVNRYLNDSSNKYAIGEQVIYESFFQQAKRENVQTLLDHSKVYYLLTSENTLDHIVDVITIIDANYHMLLVLCAGDHSFSQDLSNQDFTKMAHDCEVIIGSAYDCESYIIWEKEGTHCVKNFFHKG